MGFAAIFGGILFYILIAFLVRVPGMGLSSRFSKLGELKGKSYEEIKKAVGEPSSISVTTDKDGEPVIIRQWMETGYHIVLLFDKDDICLGISSETSV